MERYRRSGAIDRSLARNPGSASTGWPSPRGAPSNSGDNSRLALNSTIPRASARSKPSPGARRRGVACASVRCCILLFLLVAAAAERAEPGHGDEHVLHLLGKLGIEAEPALDQRLRR